MEAKLYDLHAHSNCSDGVLSPQALVERAHTNGVSHFSLTDHDTLLGLNEARAQAAALGMTFINGVEISTKWSGHSIHVIGLGFDDTAPVLCAALAELAVARESRGEKIAKKLERHFEIDNVYQKAMALSGGGVIGRPHFARILVEAGMVKNMKVAFDKYLGNGKLADVKLESPTIADAVEWINSAGGIAVLAHPHKYKLTRTKLNTLMSEFASVGGGGVEVSTATTTPDDVQKISKLAIVHNLLASQGSDFHTPDDLWADLGKFAPLPASMTPVWSRWG